VKEEYFSTTLVQPGDDPPARFASEYIASLHSNRLPAGVLICLSLGAPFSVAPPSTLPERVMTTVNSTTFPDLFPSPGSPQFNSTVQQQLASLERDFEQQLGSLRQEAANLIKQQNGTSKRSPGHHHGKQLRHDSVSTPSPNHSNHPAPDPYQQHEQPPSGKPTTDPSVGGTSPSTGSGANHSRETLSAGHGWGAQNGGVTGGSKADASHVYTVTNREQLVQALGGNNATNGSNSTPKIILIKGNIDLNKDSNGKELTRRDFASEKDQLNHDMINVGPNTTIIGVGKDAGISGGGFNVSNSHNIIIRNLTMSSPYDFFPGKDAQGNPHGRVYSIEAKGTQNLWVDHNTFKDGATPSGAISGDQIDFTDGANYATFSYNQFLSHNKSILIGSSDGMTSDKGKLNVTIDHNLFSGLSQRDPRVRFGNVEVANNLYQDSSTQSNRFQYNLGIGVDSNVTSQNNAFETNGISEQQLVKRFGSSGHLTDTGSLVNGKSVDLSSSPTGSGPGAGGIGHLDPTNQVASIVLSDAGAGRIGQGE
jgi:pectate lyase